MWPVAALGEGNPDRQMVVPDGWAAVYSRAMMRKTGFWTRVGVALLVSTLLAAVAGTVWLLVAPVWALLDGRLRQDEIRDRSRDAGRIGGDH